MVAARISRRLACVQLVIWGGLLSGAMADQATLRFMHGVWVGDGVQLSLDTKRMLANFDPAKPFQWDPLVIRNISGGMVTFWIADKRFIGLFEGDRLSLAGETFGSTITLMRRSG